MLVLVSGSLYTSSAKVRVKFRSLSSSMLRILGKTHFSHTVMTLDLIVYIEKSV